MVARDRSPARPVARTLSSSELPPTAEGVKNTECHLSPKQVSARGLCPTFSMLLVFRALNMEARGCIFSLDHKTVTENKSFTPQTGLKPEKPWPVITGFFRHSDQIFGMGAKPG
ncbi:hypothetical protein NN561_001825 [Cricetulus griseus]